MANAALFENPFDPKAPPLRLPDVKASSRPFFAKLPLRLILQLRLPEVTDGHGPRRYGPVRLTLHGRTAHGDVVAAEDGDPPRLGGFAALSLHLDVDPRTLRPVEEPEPAAAFGAEPALALCP